MNANEDSTENYLTFTNRNSSTWKSREMNQGKRAMGQRVATRDVSEGINLELYDN